MHEYKIRMTGESGMIILTPKMIFLLIEKIRDSDRKELCIPVEDILPQGYTKYLIRVLEANGKTEQPDQYIQKIYESITEQIKKLSIDWQKCFDEVSLWEHECRIQIHLSTSEIFYFLVKQKVAGILFVYEDVDEKEVKITLLYS